MSFAAPAFLAALLIVPLAVWAYLGLERRRRKGAAEFANPLLMPSVAPIQPGWRRHLPIAFYAVALAVLAVALAEPERTVAVPQERAAVVLVTDFSGSMAATDVAPSRLQAARKAAIGFLGGAPKSLRIGAVAFSDSVRGVENPDTDRSAVRDLMQRTPAQGGTATGDALDTAVRQLSSGGRRGAKPPPAAILLLSDGVSTSGRNAIEVAYEARKLRIPIYTIAFGTDSGQIQVQKRDGTTVTQPVPPDRASLEQVSKASGGKTFSATAGDQLRAVYDRLGSQIAKSDEKRQVTGLFAGGAALLLMMGGLVSLSWFGRLP